MKVAPAITDQVNTPVLLIIFNRPDHVAAAIEQLRTVRPVRLYVAGDGPRAGEGGDGLACAEARRLVEQGVDWPCELKLRFRERNLGVQHGVVDAINWLFTHENQGIVLEDDILAGPDFFRFCDEMLDRYRDDTRVATIGGTSYWQGKSPFSYHASGFIDMWGWATWRDRWQHYDGAMAAWPDFANSGRLAALPGASRRFVRYWRRIMDLTKAGDIRAWDYQWILTCWARGMVSVHPGVPLVRNRGFGQAASNTVARRIPRYCRTIKPLAFPLLHPPTLVPDPARERALWAFRFHISVWDGFVLFFKMPLLRLRERLLRFAGGRET